MITMKNIFVCIALAGTMAAISSCSELDLVPPSEASSENWYSDPDEIVISLNDMYREYLYTLEKEWNMDRRTDDWAQRDVLYDVAQGTVTSEWSLSGEFWKNSYKGISRTNRVLAAIEQLRQSGGDTETLVRLEAEARFFRAFLYSRLINTFGDVPFYTTPIELEEARFMGRTPVKEILPVIYEDFDFAIGNLPADNSSSGIVRVGCTAAMALKARTALYMEDWATARDAAYECISSGKHELYEDYGELFQLTGNAKELIFAIPRSITFAHTYAVKNFIPRTAGGNAVAQPSWELLAAYTCTDGLPIDESPLFDPHNPFKNRDPRCTYTFVEHGTTIGGFEYDPHPSKTRVMNENIGKTVKNKDARTSSNPYCAYNCMQLRKGVTKQWFDLLKTESPIIIVRYADVLLMYAEAKIELGEIDSSVNDAINAVRARAYKVDPADRSAYPAVTTTDPVALRRALRLERRMEFAWEGRRYWDLKRWRWFEKAFSCDYYGCLGATALDKKIIKPGLWFWPEVPPVDGDGFADFKPMYDKGYIQVYGHRTFDAKTYLWPIPNEDVIISDGKLTQNPGY